MYIILKDYLIVGPTNKIPLSKFENSLYYFIRKILKTETIFQVY